MTSDQLLKRIKQAARYQETSLELAGKGIKELPPEIGQLPGVTQLDIHSTPLLQGSKQEY